MSKNIWCKNLIALLLFCCTLLSAITQAGTVKLYTWEGYLSDDVIIKFEKETDHTVSQQYYDDEGVRDRAISSGRAKAHDLILTDDVGVDVLKDQGIIQDLSSIDSSNHDQQWRDACGTAGVPYTWGTMGIAYRDSVSETPITSWRQLFIPPKGHQGHIVMSYDVIDGVAAALFASGSSPFSEHKEDLVKAYELYKAQQPHLLAVGYSEKYAFDQDEKKEMTMGLSYSGEIEGFSSELGQDDWVYVVPEEGTMLWAECWTAPTGNPISEATVAFLEFLNRPEIAAINAEHIWVPVTISKAVELAGEDYRTDKSLFPSEEILSRSIHYQQIGKAGLDMRNRMMNKLSATQR